MSYDDRAALVSVVDETYALIGAVLAAPVPVAVGAIRPEVVDNLRNARLESRFEPSTLSTLRDDYGSCFESVLELQQALLGDEADGYDDPLAAAGFGNEGDALVAAFQQTLARLVPDTSIADAGLLRELLHQATAALTPLNRADGLATISKPLLQLIASVEGQFRQST